MARRRDVFGDDVARAERISGLSPIPWTLQRYIFREMGKTFVLTAVALSAILGLGGGVLNMIQMGDVTTGQFLRLIALVVPLSVALTLPVAALFSAASTYGRLSADNEFVACRSSGINMHVLFLPTIVLSLFSATVTFACINFVIPGMVRSLTEFIAADFPALIQKRMSQPGGFRLEMGRRCYADSASVDPEDPDRVILEGVAYIEVNENDWVRFGTAGSVVLEVDRSHSTPRVAARMFDVTYYDRIKGQFADIGEQQILPKELPDLNQLKLKFLKLGELAHYRCHPDEWFEVAEVVQALRLQVGASRVFEALAEAWLSGGHRFTLADEQGTFEIAAASAVKFGDGTGLQLTDVVIVERRRGRTRTCRAERADVEIARRDTTEESGIRMGMARHDAIEESGIRVEAYQARIEFDDQVIERPKETLGPVAIPESLVAAVTSMPLATLLAVDPSLSPSHPIQRRRAAANQIQSQTLRSIDAVISERFAFSASVFVLVILGAALGIVFRGSHAIVSFGISFVPSLLVLVTIVTGKQMAQNEGTYLTGLSLMWVGIALVAALDVWTLTKVVRR